MLEDPQYDGYESDEIAVVLNDDYPVRSVDRIVVTVSSRAPGANPALTDDIYAALADRIGEPLRVEVEYVVSEERGRQPDEQGIIETEPVSS